MNLTYRQRDYNPDGKEIPFTLVKRVGHDAMWLWHLDACVDGEDRWINLNGGWTPKHVDDEVNCIVLAKCFEALDWSRSDILDKREGITTGWLSPAGKYYPCRTEDHDFVAYFIIRKDIVDLEKGNWCRLRGVGGGKLVCMNINAADFVVEGRLSPEQRNKMLYMGYKLTDDD